jgi:hypothetical protein
MEINSVVSGDGKTRPPHCVFISFEGSYKIAGLNQLAQILRRTNHRAPNTADEPITEGYTPQVNQSQSDGHRRLTNYRALDTAD